MSDNIFNHSQYGPYQQYASIHVNDGGNGLPIHLTMATGDPPSRTSNSMTISMAKWYQQQLGEAIEAAKKAGIKDAGS